MQSIDQGFLWMSVVIDTNLGSLKVNLLTDQAPNACLNFLKLSKIRYYEYCVFHRIEKDFIAQTGDPTGTGKGGESVFSLLGGPRFFADELCKTGLGFNKKGVLGMASSGRNKNASQFFLTLADGIDYLDEQYTAFGCLEGEESFKVLGLINEIICDEKGKPLQKVWIKGIQILQDPFEDHPGLIIPKTVEPSPAFLSFAGIDASLSLERESEIPPEELEARRKKADAEAHALTLEILGDLPSADVKPPENVLFVCKLNPMTEDEDLKQVFSRFGSILSCQIIRDKETKNSLGYAFIEFEEVSSCEEAYLKMDNVLLDDRRIHVDFSQSVSKLHGLWQTARRSQLRRTAHLARGIELKQSGKREDGYEMLFDPLEVERARRDNSRDGDTQQDHVQRDRHIEDRHRDDYRRDDRRRDYRNDDRRDDYRRGQRAYDKHRHRSRSR